MKSYTIFDRNTGRGIKFGQASNLVIQELRNFLDVENQYLHEGQALARTHWFDSSIELPEVVATEDDPGDTPDESIRIVPRVDAGLVISATEVAPGEVVEITNIPVGAKFMVENVEHTINDGILQITLHNAGSYIVQFDQIPYLPEHIDLIAQEAA